MSVRIEHDTFEKLKYLQINIGVLKQKEVKETSQ